MAQTARVASNRHGEREIIEPGCAGDRKRRRPQGEMRLRDAGKAHVSTRHADPVLGDRLTDDDESERTHDEGGRPKPQGRDPERKSDQASHQAGSDEIDVERCPIMNRQKTSGIGANAEECGLRQR